MPTYTYLRWYSTPTWSSFVFCMLFFRCWVPDFLFYIILALLLPRFLCFFLFVCSFVKVVKLLPLKPVASSSFWTLEKYPESQIPAKEQSPSSRILSIWLPRSEHVFRWGIWLPSPSMLTCRLPRKDPGQRTASNCRFLSPKIIVNWKKSLEVEWPTICWKKSNPWICVTWFRKMLGGRKVKVLESRYYDSWCNTIFHARLFFPCEIPIRRTSFCFFVVHLFRDWCGVWGWNSSWRLEDQIQHSKNVCVYQILQHLIVGDYSKMCTVIPQ